MLRYPPPFRGRSVGGSRLFDIPNAPTVARDPLGRWSKLTEEVVWYYKGLAADALNDIMNSVARDSLVEVPKGPRYDETSGELIGTGGLYDEGSLAASIRAPFNDGESLATAEYMTAYVSYDTPYAGVQHEGLAEMMHEHPIIPGKMGFFERTEVIEPHLVEWVAVSYTTPGTKSHYLSDPYIAKMPFAEARIAGNVRRGFLGEAGTF